MGAKRLINMSRAERAHHAYDTYKTTTLEKKIRTNGVNVECFFCPDQFKPGDVVYLASNRSYAHHAACVKREVARDNAAKAAERSPNVLETLLEKEENGNGNGHHGAVAVLDKPPAIKRGQFKTIERKADPARAERLEVNVGNLNIVITFRE